MTIQHLEGFALGVGVCGIWAIWYRRTVVIPLFKIIEEFAPWIETKKLQDGQDAFLASLKPNEQPAEIAMRAGAAAVPLPPQSLDPYYSDMIQSQINQPCVNCIPSPDCNREECREIARMAGRSGQ